MSKSQIIAVTAEHIANARKKSSSHCMTQMAVKAALPAAARISVDIQTIRYTLDGIRYTYLTPRAVQIAIIDWDDGVPIAPFTFTLNGRAHMRVAHVQTEEQKEKERDRNKGRLEARKGRSGSTIPNVVGGKSPPVSRFAKRREFGLKAFQRKEVAQEENLVV